MDAVQLQLTIFPNFANVFKEKQTNEITLMFIESWIGFKSNGIGDSFDKKFGDLRIRMMKNRFDSSLDVDVIFFLDQAFVFC